MPQFDLTTFFTQVLWFILIFFSFYFIISYYFLPLISLNIKFRKKKIQNNIQNKFYLFFEKINKEENYINKYINNFNIIKDNIQLILNNNNINNKYLKNKILNKNILNKNILFFFNKYFYYIF